MNLKTRRSRVKANDTRSELKKKYREQKLGQAFERKVRQFLTFLNLRAACKLSSSKSTQFHTIQLQETAVNGKSTVFEVLQLLKSLLQA